MAAAVPAAAATSTTPPAMMSDAAMAAWVAALPSHLRAATLDPSSLRAICPDNGRDSLWHEAAKQGRTDVCEYLKSKGLLDLISQGGGHGFTPLHLALISLPLHLALIPGQEDSAARWMVANGADVNAVSGQGFSVFYFACQRMSPSFVEQLAGKVAPEHLAMSSNSGCDWSPMKTAFVHSSEPTAVVRVLILRGVPVRAEDFPPEGSWEEDLLPRRRELIASLEPDLDLNDRTFLGLFLAGGVHAPYTTPACTTTATTATTKRVRTQRPDGSWSDPVMVPCEPHLVVTAAPTIRRSGRVAARVENHLPKLRGLRNTEVRMEIAGFLGVREALDLKRLRAARDALAALPEEEEASGEEELSI